MTDRENDLAERLVNLIQAVASGDWFEIDLAVERAKLELGFDPMASVGEEESK